MAAVSWVLAVLALHVPQERRWPRGFAYVVGVAGCERGCERIERGDFVQSVDGVPMTSLRDLDPAAIADGRPHVLGLFTRRTLERIDVEIVARPRADGRPPLSVASANALDRAPEWARRRLFARMSPVLQLVGLDGTIVDGRTLVGRKRFVVYWSCADANEQAAAIAFLQVLQKAQADLAAANVDILFAHVVFPGRRPMTDTELRVWRDAHGLVQDGRAYPLVPFYRRPERHEHDAAREVGLEVQLEALAHVRDSPAIVLLDARGVVRWHSEGVQDPPSDAVVQRADQYTVIEAIRFALEQL